MPKSGRIGSTASVKNKQTNISLSYLVVIFSIYDATVTDYSFYNETLELVATCCASMLSQFD